MLSSPWFAALAALFLWWFSAGAILWAVKSADRRGARGHRAVALAGLPLVPLPDERLWRWMMPEPPDNTTRTQDRNLLREKRFIPYSPQGDGNCKCSPSLTALAIASLPMSLIGTPVSDAICSRVR